MSIDNIISKTVEYLKIPSVVGFDGPFLDYLAKDFSKIPGYKIEKREKLLILRRENSESKKIITAHYDRHGLIVNENGEFEHAGFFLKRHNGTIYDVKDYVIEKEEVMSETADVVSGGKVSAWSHFGALAQTYGEDYQPVKHKKYPANAYRLKIFNEILSELRPSLVLDIGCGTGEPMVDFLNAGHAVLGIDKSPEMITKSQANLAAANFEPSLVSFGDMEMPEGLPEEPFDCFVALGAVYYAEKFGVTMRGLVDRLPPGGHFIFSLRNELFSLFSLNNYTKRFFEDRLVPYEEIDKDLKFRVDLFFSERLNQLEQKRSFETVDTMGVHSIMHNPLTVEKEVLVPIVDILN